MKATGHPFVRSVLLLLLIGAVMLAVGRRNAVKQLRAEHEALSAELREAEQLRSENQEIEKLRAENEEVKQLRVANADLPGLRNRHHQLQRQIQELDALRVENQQLKNLPATMAAGVPTRQVIGSPFPRAGLKDAGLGMPVATIETFFWAMCAGDVQRVRQCLTPEAAVALANETAESFRQRMAAEMAGFTGYEIIGRNQTASDEIVLTIKSSATGETTEGHFKRIGNEWKFNP